MTTTMTLTALIELGGPMWLRAIDGYGGMRNVHLVRRDDAHDPSTSEYRALCGRRNNHWITTPGAVNLALAEGAVDGDCRQCARRAEHLHHRTSRPA